MHELNHCPFCGGEVEIDDREMFTCLDCGLIARFPSSPKQIKNAANGLFINNYDTEWHINRWNTRVEHTCEIVGFTSAVRDSRGLIEYPPVWNLSCGHEAAWWKPLSCPTCGAKVVNE